MKLFWTLVQISPSKVGLFLKGLFLSIRLPPPVLHTQPALFARKEPVATIEYEVG